MQIEFAAYPISQPALTARWHEFRLTLPHASLTEAALWLGVDEDSLREVAAAHGGRSLQGFNRGR